MNKTYIPSYSNYPIPYLNIDYYKFDPNVTKLVSKKLVKDYNIIPLDNFNNILTVVMLNPIIETIHILEKATRKTVRVFRGNSNQIKNKINQLY